MTFGWRVVDETFSVDDQTLRKTDNITNIDKISRVDFLEINMIGRGLLKKKICMVEATQVSEE